MLPDSWLRAGIPENGSSYTEGESDSGTAQAPLEALRVGVRHRKDGQSHPVGKPDNKASGAEILGVFAHGENWEPVFPDIQGRSAPPPGRDGDSLTWL